MTLSEIRDAFYEYVEWHGATHGIDPSGIECPQDDTCECEFKPFNDRINEAYRALDELAKADALDARPQTWQPIDSHDGSSANVLVGHDGSHGSPRWVCEARWDADQRGWWEANTHHTDHCDRQVFPTHFCELPDPPVSDRRLPDASTPPDRPEGEKT
jgi:hypothetical protein